MVSRGDEKQNRKRGKIIGQRRKKEMKEKKKKENKEAKKEKEGSPQLGGAAYATCTVRLHQLYNNYITICAKCACGSLLGCIMQIFCMVTWAAADAEAVATAYCVLRYLIYSPLVGFNFLHAVPMMQGP